MKNFRKTSFAIVFALYYGTVAYAGNGQGNGPPETPPGHNKVISSVDNIQTNTLTGGNSVATTGNQTLTGGNSVATTGNQTLTGGNSNATSNANSSTQSTATSQGGTGGNSYATGGMGGTGSATGGTSTASSISSGGNSHATGGNATGGTSTSTANGGMATGGTSTAISTGGTATTGASTSSSFSGPSTSSSSTGASTSRSGDSSAVTGASTSSVNVEIGCTSNCGSNSIDGEIADKRIAADKEIAAGHDQALRDAANSKIRNTPSMFGPALISSNDTCMGSTSGSVAAPGLGIGFGTTWVDENCKMLKNSQVLWNMGFKAASVALLCNDEKIKSALEVTGFACPPIPVKPIQEKVVD